MAAIMRTVESAPIHVIVPNTDLEPLITGQLEPLPIYMGEDGGYVKGPDLYRALARLLHEMADGLNVLALEEDQ